MKMQLDNIAADTNTITAYTTGSVTVSGKIFNSSLVVSAETLMEDWRPAGVADIRVSDLELVLALQPELVLLGTGPRLVFPGNEITHFFHSRGIGIEVMDTAAACRAYNIMIADDRRVAAVLFIPENP